VELAVGVLLDLRRGQEQHGGDMASAKGTPVFCPSSPWHAMQ
jgi:hypothetical protein